MKYVVATRPINSIGTDNEEPWVYKYFETEEEANDYAASQAGMQIACGTAK